MVSIRNVTFFQLLYNIKFLLCCYFCSCASVPGVRDAEFVRVQAINPRIRVDLRYATTNNFSKQQLYPTGIACYVRRTVAEKLDKVQRELETMGLGLKLYDGYRPLSVQKTMWELIRDERYVANPVNGSRHNRGAAVDLTLVRLDDGQELPMPTEFDDFTEKAHRNYQNLSAEQLKNRTLLQTIMEKHGFIGLATEWWHFDDKNWQHFPITDADSVWKQ